MFVNILTAITRLVVPSAGHSGYYSVEQQLTLLKINGSFYTPLITRHVEISLVFRGLKECGHTQTINIINGVCLMKEELLGCTMASLQMKRVIFYPFVIESD